MNYEFRYRSSVRIRGFHPRERGSTPRIGINFSLLFIKYYLIIWLKLFEKKNFELIYLFNIFLYFKFNTLVLKNILMINYNYFYGAFI